MFQRPPFAELPRPSGEDLPLAWGLEQQDVGMLASITPERAAEAARLVTSGRRVNLDLPLHFPLSVLPSHAHRIRREPVHELDRHRHQGLLTRDDRLTFHLQASSQWDALAHIGDPTHGFYNGAKSEDIHPGEGARDGVDRYADFGIFTRGIYVDLPEFFERTGRPWSSVGSHVCTADDLRDALKLFDLKPRMGDVLCVRTGWLEAFRAADQAGKERLFLKYDYSGLSGDPSMWELLWDSGFAAVASDTVTVEVWPLEEGRPSLHLAIARLGLVLGEMFDLDALHEAVSEEGRREFLFTSKPLNLVGGIGSPPNAMAVF